MTVPDDSSQYHASIWSQYLGRPPAVDQVENLAAEIECFLGLMAHERERGSTDPEEESFPPGIRRLRPDEEAEVVWRTVDRWPPPGAPSGLRLIPWDEIQLQDAIDSVDETPETAEEES